MRTRILLLLPRTAPARCWPTSRRAPRFYSTSASSPASFTELRKSLLTAPPTTEPALLSALQQLRERAEATAAPAPKPIEPTPSSPTAAILSKAQSQPSPAPQTQHEPDHSIPDLAFTLLQRATESKSLSLTPPILSSYIDVCISSSCPSAIPPALSLYAAPAPKHPRNAIPASLADLSLVAALNQRDMETSLDIIDLSYGAPAFVNRKILTVGLPYTLTAGFLLPAAFWSAATTLAEYQDTVPLETARGYAFAGLLCYGVFTGALGLVAVVTRNDQMRRVRWIPGTPLRNRWEREEERAALDAVAVAWGFRERERWGEESGREWELLRDVVGRKGMVLDLPQSMPGMQ